MCQKIRSGVFALKLSQSTNPYYGSKIAMSGLPQQMLLFIFQTQKFRIKFLTILINFV